MELEVLIREFSETLIAELALRDELEYEKELKNTFISLLLAVQNKRRQYHIEKKKRPQPPRSPNLNSGPSESKVRLLNFKSSVEFDHVHLVWNMKFRWNSQHLSIPHFKNSVILYTTVMVLISNTQRPTPSELAQNFIYGKLIYSLGEFWSKRIQ